MVSKKIAIRKVSKKRAIEEFLMITKPMHRLTTQEIKVLTLILYIYYNEEENFKREEDRWKHIFDYETKNNIKDELNISNPVFQNILTSLRKKGVLENNQVLPKFRPNILKGDEVFELTFRFELINGQ